MGVMKKIYNLLGLQEEEWVEQERIEEEDEHVESNSTEQRKYKGNIVSIHAQKNIRVVLTEPRSYEETQEIADHLRSRKPAVVNLQRVRPDQAMRIVDFLSGTVYALNGSISKIGPNIFLCTPDTVEIQGTISEMLEDEADYKNQR
ncbi:MAG: cell division protein SepF [Paenibacillus sp. RIFOXYA1_FULL_44_5]|nr:MAG: cell division protein SepF [Paenibacillus sp. RIFOXYA1_FULL_44_5]